MRKSKINNWRLAVFAALLFPALVWAKTPALPGWESWRANFVSREGRIIDTGQAGISHSEGQGTGLLLAAAAQDRATFERIWNWTRANLQTRDDALFSWRWDARENRVTDSNDASDGDLLIAWGLLRGAHQFRRPDLRSAAIRILADVRRVLLRDAGTGRVMLPGAQGFEHEAGRVLNLSYWIFPALPEFAQADPSPEWGRLRDGGLSLLDRTHLGRWGLPPDWLLDATPPLAAPDYPARFGYDAVRIPLYLKWAGLDTPERMAPFQSYWRYFEGARFVPAWTNLNDNSVDSYHASAGIRAVRSWVLGKPVKVPATFAGEDYYSAALCMLVRLAAHESARR